MPSGTNVLQDAPSIIDNVGQLFSAVAGRIGTITTQFLAPVGYYPDGKHHGIDYAIPAGTLEYAPTNGRIVDPKQYGYTGPQLGNAVGFLDDNGFLSIFGHANGPLLPWNTPVIKGTPLSTVSGIIRPGENSSGAHLHYEVTRNGQQINPLDYLKGLVTGILPGGVIPSIPGNPQPRPPQPPTGSNGQGTQIPPSSIPGQITPSPQVEGTNEYTFLPEVVTLAKLGPWDINFEPRKLFPFLLRLLLTLIALFLILWGMIKLFNIDKQAEKLVNIAAKAV